MVNQCTQLANGQTENRLAKYSQCLLDSFLSVRYTLIKTNSARWRKGTGQRGEDM